jgi:hypothetical protein
MYVSNVVINPPAVELGLANAAIAYEEAWMGSETFVFFGDEAVTLLSGQGEAAQLLS